MHLLMKRENLLSGLLIEEDQSMCLNSIATTGYEHRAWCDALFIIGYVPSLVIIGGCVNTVAEVSIVG